MDDGTPAFVITAALALLAATIASHAARRTWRPPLLAVGVLMRIVGALASYAVIMNQYGGIADAVLYYRKGLRFADQLWSGDWAGFLMGIAAGDRWWGTSFVEWLSGAVLAVVGPSLRAEFLVFALISFLGLLAMAEAVRRETSPARAHRFAAFVFLWPSLWFWLSIVGKDALVMLGVGLAFLGYVGKGRRPQWVWLTLGIAVTFCSRPHVALVLMIGLLLAHFFRPTVRFSLARAAQLVVIAVATIVVFTAMTNLFGLEDMRQQQITEFAQLKAENTLRGGSSMGRTPIQEGKPWLALLNMWMRPFPWEATSGVALLAAAEVLTFWVALFYFRKTVWRNLRQWRQHVLLRFALPVILGYSLMLGSVVGNLGILVRQRTIIIPLAFLLIAADTRPYRRPLNSRR